MDASFWSGSIALILCIPSCFLLSALFAACVSTRKTKEHFSSKTPARVQATSLVCRAGTYSLLDRSRLRALQYRSGDFDAE
jgi:hypothetical protein